VNALKIPTIRTATARAIIALGLLASANAFAASATLTWPGSINLNLTNGLTAIEDTPTRLTTISVTDPSLTTQTLSQSTDWDTPLSANGGSTFASPTLLQTSSPGQGTMIDVLRTTSYTFGPGNGSGSVAFDYSFTVDSNPSAFSLAILSMTVIHADNTFTTFTQQAQSGGASSTGTLTLNFSFLAGESGVLAVDLITSGQPVTAAPVPVPAALPMLLSGIAALGGCQLRRRRARQT